MNTSTLLTNSSNETLDAWDLCDVVNNGALFVVLSVPSILLLFLLCFTQKRKNMFPGCCGGRPALLPPINVLSSGHKRLSYAAAHGLAAQIFLLFVFGDTSSLHLFWESDIPVLQGIYKAFTAFLFGTSVYPIFAAIYSESLGVCLLGILYVWGLLGFNIAGMLDCIEQQEFANEGLGLDMFIRFSNVFLLIPIFLAEIYLAFSLPCRLFTSARRCYLARRNDANLENEDLLSKQSAPFRYVQRLLANSKEVKSTRLGMRLLRCFYDPVKDFQFPQHFVSTFTVALIIVYMVFISLFSGILPLIELVKPLLHLTGDEETASTIITIIYVVIYVPLLLSLFVTLFMMLGAVDTFKNDLLSLYRGDYSTIPRLNPADNAAFVAASMTYSGYQIAFIAIGLFVHFFLLFVILTLLTGILVVPFLLFHTTIIFEQVLIWGTGPLFGIVLLLCQRLLARFLFLQHKEWLAIDNRRLFFTLTYFMAFYNTIIGIFQSLKRIAVSFIVTSVFMSRIDRSVLPRRLELCDSGSMLHSTAVLLLPSFRILFLRRLPARDACPYQSYAPSLLLPAATRPGPSKPRNGQQQPCTAVGLLPGGCRVFPCSKEAHTFVEKDSKSFPSLAYAHQNAHFEGIQRSRFGLLAPTPLSRFSPRGEKGSKTQRNQ